MEERTPNNLVLLTPIEELNKHVPMKALQELVDEAAGEQESSKYATKEALLDEVQALVEKKTISLGRINKLVQDYKFAGRVSVCWGIPLERTALLKSELEKAILSKNSVNPFEEEIKPQLTQRPAFNSAEWLSNNLLRLEFVYAGKSYEIEDNYEKRIIVPTKRLNSYIRLLEKTFVVETRASIRESKLVYDSVSLLLGVEIVSMTFTNQDIAFLKKELNGKSKAAKHKRFGGDLDTIYVSASPGLDDLDSSEEYKNNFTHGDLRETRLEFLYTSSSKNKIESSLHISSQGNIWFMSDVPEELIEYVFAIVHKIKFLPPVKKLGLKSSVTTTDETIIQSLVNAIRKSGYGKRFNPRIYKTLGFELDERKWIETISKLVRLGYLTERFELVCPDCHETIKVYFDYKDIPLDEALSCIHCGHEFEVSEEDILLTYSFKEDIELAQDPESQDDQVVLAQN
ncbi:hypothetical protein C7B61_10730 [filamentous cyanobacterium CCP1]|nr:hypothetical protein C7B76_14985 [filamentous cyanobacterium CCP2]PSB65977.1 hypothetical protein C7B61_10730 [filamentous cyanobacterium CCP1]